MPYRAPVSEFLFCLEHVVGFDRVAATERFAEATPETVAAMLTEAGRICEEVLAPLNRAGDLHPARLENGVVRTSPGFGDGWRAIAEAGFVALAADAEHGGLGMPMAVTSSVNEMIAGRVPRAATRAPDEPGPDRGAGPPRERRPQGDLPAEARVGRMERDHEPDRVAGGVRRGPRSAAGRSRREMAPMPSRARRSTSRGATTISRKIPSTSCLRACPTRPRAPRGSAFSSCPSACPMPTATPVSPTR